VALDAPMRSLVLAVPEPAELAAAQLKRLLESRGVRVTGRSRARHAGDPVVVLGKPSNSPTVLAERLSPPLLEDVRLANKMSQNLYAELLLRVAAKERAGAETLEDALKFASQFYDMIGLMPGDVLQSDGSGLSRDNLATPRSVVGLLLYAAAQTWGADFAATLPVAGEDGTLENRMKGTAAAGRVRAKTGTVNNAVATSGYATSLGGRDLVFSLFSNNHGNGGREAAAAMDAICVAMVEELGVELAPPTEPSNEPPSESPHESPGEP
jgi:D-alanyl-D-alanine carboxypeptidase/D-alanyl-D-alanine-endopeptidase (penicillin-binding protein 4)